MLKIDVGIVRILLVNGLVNDWKMIEFCLIVLIIFFKFKCFFWFLVKMFDIEWL